MKITIRPAQVTDEQEIRELLSQITKVHNAIRPDIFRSDYECDNSTVSECLDEPIFVAVNEQNTIVGGLWCIIMRERGNTLKLDRDWLVIDDICVDEKFRKQGIGQQLLNFACSVAKENGLNKIELNVYNDNKEAVNFYYKNNFKTQKRVMELDLN